MYHNLVYAPTINLTHYVHVLTIVPTSPSHIPTPLRNYFFKQQQQQYTPRKHQTIRLEKWHSIMHLTMERMQSIPHH